MKSHKVESACSNLFSQRVHSEIASWTSAFTVAPVSTNSLKCCFKIAPQIKTLDGVDMAYNVSGCSCKDGLIVFLTSCSIAKLMSVKVIWVQTSEISLLLGINEQTSLFYLGKTARTFWLLWNGLLALTVPIERALCHLKKHNYDFVAAGIWTVLVGQQNYGNLHGTGAAKVFLDHSSNKGPHDLHDYMHFR